MQYFGGKHRHVAWLKEHVLPISKGRRLLEPFCGGLSATVGLQPAVASDVSPALIVLYKAIRNGWEPPTELSYDQYKELQTKQDHNNPMTAFAGFGCSFGGKWFAGYARGDAGRNYASAASRGIVKKVRAVPDTDFKACPYSELSVQAGDVLYCDPPYGATTHGYDAPKWDIDKFWTWAQWCVDACGATVLVSEFSAPAGTAVVASRDAWSGVDGHNSGTRKTIEQLYRLG